MPFNACGFANGVVYGRNVDFTGVDGPTAQVLADGQLLIGATATPNIRVGTLTAGAGISIANGAGSITITAVGSGFTWSDKAISFAAVAQNGYMSTAAGVTATLPAAGSANGTAIAFITTTTDALTIVPSTTDTIRMDAVLSTNGTGGGQMVSTTAGSSCELVYQSSSGTWQALNFNGNWTIT